MRVSGSLFLLFAGACLGLCTGCGPGTATISGTVTVDGKSLEKGIISYVSADGSGQPAMIAIENGQYTLTTTPGKKLVQISAPVVTGKRPQYNGPKAPLEDITKESLPERFNAKTELTFDASSGANKKDWDLDTKAK